MTASISSVFVPTEESSDPHSLWFLWLWEVRRIARGLLQPDTSTLCHTEPRPPPQGSFQVCFRLTGNLLSVWLICLLNMPGQKKS